MLWKYEAEKRAERVMWALLRRLPKKVIYFVMIQGLAKYSTHDDHSHEDMNKVPVMDVVKFYE